MPDATDHQLALQDLAYGHGMLQALKEAEQGASESARKNAERRIEEALRVLNFKVPRVPR
jgi:hypothetical protein